MRSLRSRTVQLCVSRRREWHENSKDVLAGHVSWDVPAWCPISDHTSCCRADDCRFAEYAANIYEAGTIAGSGTAADYYLYVMQGMYIYKFSPDSTFVIPISWFMLHIGLAYLTAYYPCKDYNEYGAIVLPAGGSRVRWWIAKMFWCLMTVFLYYIGIAVTCTISACVHGAKLSADFSVDLLEHLYGDSMNYVSQSDMILISVLLPFAISVLMTEVQMLSVFCLHPL